MPRHPAHATTATPIPDFPTRGVPRLRAALGLLAALALVLAACGETRTVVVYQQSPPPQTTTVQAAPTTTYYQPPPPPPPQQQTVVVEQQWNDEETNVVIYREYYGCSEDEIYVMPHYRRYYQVDNDDLFFVCFVARNAHVSFDVAFNEWYFGCGRDCGRMVAYYRVDPGVFFVYAPPGYAYPPIYAHPYACYHNQQLAGATFSNGEYHALVSLRIGVEYQGCTTDVFFRNTVAYGSPSRVVYQSRDRCGMGGHGCAGMAVHVGVRPWTLSASARAQWRQDDANRRSARDAPFREQHREELARVQRGEGVRPGAPEHRAGEPGEPPRHEEPHVTHPAADRPQGGEPRPQGERPLGETRPAGERIPGEQRPQGERYPGEQRPAVERTPGEQRPPSERPPGSDQRQQTQRQAGDRPGGGGDAAHSPQGGQQRSQESHRPSEGQGGRERDAK